MPLPIALGGLVLALVALVAPVVAQNAKKPAAVTFPPALPDGKAVVSHTGDEFLKAPDSLRKGVAVAKTAPTVDFLYFPGQDYEGNPWSNWGDSLAAQRQILPPASATTWRSERATARTAPAPGWCSSTTPRRRPSANC